MSVPSSLYSGFSLSQTPTPHQTYTRSLSPLGVRNFSLMDAISPAIGSKLFTPANTYDRSGLFSGASGFSTLRLNKSKLNGICKNSRVYAESKSSNIDFSDPDWKSKYEEDFESRFNIPHLTDVFDDAVSYPSTFCLKMRYSLNSF